MVELSPERLAGVGGRMEEAENAATAAGAVREPRLRPRFCRTAARSSALNQAAGGEAAGGGDCAGAGGAAAGTAVPHSGQTPVVLAVRL